MGTQWNLHQLRFTTTCPSFSSDDIAIMKSAFKHRASLGRHWQRLPSEVQEYVLELVGRSSCTTGLLEASMVCKAWRAALEPHIFHHAQFPFSYQAGPYHRGYLDGEHLRLLSKHTKSCVISLDDYRTSTFMTEGEMRTRCERDLDQAKRLLTALLKPLHFLSIRPMLSVLQEETFRATLFRMIGVARPRSLHISAMRDEDSVPLQLVTGEEGHELSTVRSFRLCAKPFTLTSVTSSIATMPRLVSLTLTFCDISPRKLRRALQARRPFERLCLGFCPRIPPHDAFELARDHSGSLRRFIFFAAAENEQSQSLDSGHSATLVERSRDVSARTSSGNDFPRLVTLGVSINLERGHARSQLQLKEELTRATEEVLREFQSLRAPELRTLGLGNMLKFAEEDALRRALEAVLQSEAHTKIIETFYECLDGSCLWSGDTHQRVSVNQSVIRQTMDRVPHTVNVANLPAYAYRNLL